MAGLKERWSSSSLFYPGPICSAKAIPLKKTPRVFQEQVSNSPMIKQQSLMANSIVRRRRTCNYPSRQSRSP
jgi:hypothetical protein